MGRFGTSYPKKGQQKTPKEEGQSPHYRPTSRGRGPVGLLLPTSPQPHLREGSVWGMGPSRAASQATALPPRPPPSSKHRLHQNHTQPPGPADVGSSLRAAPRRASQPACGLLKGTRMRLGQDRGTEEGPRDQDEGSGTGRHGGREGGSGGRFRARWGQIPPTASPPRAPTMGGVPAPCGGPREPPVGRGASLWAPREEPGSRPSPAGQLAARGPGRSAPDENANLQLAGALNKSGETKQAEAPANPSLGCFQNKREGGARRRRVPGRDRGSQGAPRPPPSCAPGPARPVTRVGGRRGVGGGVGNRPGSSPPVPGARGSSGNGPAPRGHPRRGARGRRASLTGTPGRAEGRTMTAAAVTWAPEQPPRSAHLASGSAQRTAGHYLP